MKLPIAFLLAASVASFAISAESAAPSKAAPMNAVGFNATFACGDSLPRADGTQSAGTPCSIAHEYCYEASGGSPFSHGARCRALPKPGATCADLVAASGAGSACTGTSITGLRIQFAYP